VLKEFLVVRLDQPWANFVVAVFLEPVISLLARNASFYSLAAGSLKKTISATRLMLHLLRIAFRAIRLRKRLVA